MTRRLLTLLIAVTAVGLARPVLAQELPEYTPAQRWARAESLLNSWVVFALRYGEMMGQTVEETADAAIEMYGPGWSLEMGPRDMLRAMHRNVMHQQGAQFEVLAESEDEVRFRFGRTYIVSYFGDDLQAYGVTVEAYERLLELFQRGIAQQRGMDYASRTEGDWVYVTVTSR